MSSIDALSTVTVLSMLRRLHVAGASTAVPRDSSRATSLASSRLETIWSLLEAKGVDRTLIARSSMLAPATCNLLNIDKTVTVDNAFMLLKELAIYLKGKYL